MIDTPAFPIQEIIVIIRGKLLRFIRNMEWLLSYKTVCYFALATQNKRPWAKVIILADSRSRTMPKWTKRQQKIEKFSSARQPMPRPSPHSSTEELRNQKNRLDHRENDSRAISSCACQLLSDSNEKIVKLRQKTATLHCKPLLFSYIIHIFAQKWKRNTRYVL